MFFLHFLLWFLKFLDISIEFLIFNSESLKAEIYFGYAGRGIDASGTGFGIDFELVGGTFEVSGRGCCIAINLVAIGSWNPFKLPRDKMAQIN